MQSDYWKNLYLILKIKALKTAQELNKPQVHGDNQAEIVGPQEYKVKKII